METKESKTIVMTQEARGVADSSSVPLSGCTSRCGASQGQDAANQPQEQADRVRDLLRSLLDLSLEIETGADMLHAWALKADLPESLCILAGEVREKSDIARILLKVLLFPTRKPGRLVRDTLHKMPSLEEQGNSLAWRMAALLNDLVKRPLMPDEMLKTVRKMDAAADQFQNQLSELMNIVGYCWS